MGEVPLPPGRVSWQKSSVSSGGDCLEFARTREHVWVRDSKNPAGPALGFTSKGWATFLIGIRCSEFTAPDEALPPVHRDQVFAGP